MATMLQQTTTTAESAPPHAPNRSEAGTPTPTPTPTPTAVPANKATPASGNRDLPDPARPGAAEQQPRLNSSVIQQLLANRRNARQAQNKADTKAQEELERVRLELEQKQHRESNLARFARQIRWRNEDTLESWTEHVLNYFAENFPILQGAFYYREENEQQESPGGQQAGANPTTEAPQPYLRLVSGYALDSAFARPYLDYGEGLVGQAAKTRRHNYLKHLGGMDTSARSSMGHIQAKAILEMPLVYNEQSEGVIELTFDQPQPHEEVDLMLALAEMAAANLNTIRNQEIRSRLYREATEKSRMLMARDQEMQEKIAELEETQQEMRQIQDDLRDQEAQMTSVLDSTGEEIFALDQKRNITFYNSATEHFARTHLGEMLQPGDAYSKLVPESVIPIYEEHLPTVLQGEPASFETEVTFPNGRKSWREVRLNPIKSSHGQVFGATVFRKDITERKRQEQDIIQLNEHLEEKVAERTQELEEKNRDIVDSIRYARRIQKGILPDRQQLFASVNEAFIYYTPKDIVSGDFYWFARVNRELVIAVVDCTGHGVPGAFMSVVGSYALNKIVKDEQITQPGEILNRMNVSVQNTLRHDDESDPNAQIHDGMDISLIRLNLDTHQLQFAGAKRPLYYVQHGKLQTVAGTKYAIGENCMDGQYPEFENNTLQLAPGDMVYLFSDGIVDQFGGDEGKKFTPKRLRNLLEQHHSQPALQQEKQLRQAVTQWHKGYDQTDDILMLGFRV